MNTNTKMEWYVEALLKGQREFNIKKSGRKFGTVCLPTGAGKSAIIFDDMMKNIGDNGDKRIVFNLVSPIIKLKNQTVEDFISVISNEDIRAFYEKISKAIDAKQVAFYNNSSDAHKYGSDEAGYVGKELNKLPTETNRVIIIDNCLKSFPKAIKALSDLFAQNNWDRNDTYVITYIDESHKLTTNKTRAEDENSDYDYVDIKKLREVSNSIIAISATPDNELTDVLNEMQGVKCFNDDYSNKFIFYKSPKQCIDEGLIVEPNFHIAVQSKGSDGALDVDTCIASMKSAKSYLPNIYHKVLVNCRDIQQIDELTKALRERGYTVFATHSRENDPEITKKVDDFVGDCFVVHCRQLIAGIDISSLTDCVIPVFGYDDLYLELIIQTIGRTMRSAKGERGMLTSKRTKPYCNVFFVTDKDSYELAYENALVLLAGYYKAGTIDFKKIGQALTAKGNHEEIEMDKKHKALIEGVYDSINKLIVTPQNSALVFYRRNYHRNTAYLAEKLGIFFASAGSVINCTNMSNGNKALFVKELLNSMPEGATKEEWNEIKKLVRMNIKKVA